MPRPKRRADIRLRSLRRQTDDRQQRKRVLIVCCGKETEPRYFSALRRDLRVSGEIVGADQCGTDARSVVAHAVDKGREARRWRENYDAIWCVFDCDEDPTVPEALNRAQAIPGIEAAYSNPCFEIWFLLHFRYSHAEIHRHTAQAECGHWIEGYHKSMDVYEVLLVHQPQALTNTRRLREEHHALVNEGRPDNPSTDVDRMVLALTALAAKQESASKD